jgi:hypothetical protein
VSPTAIPTRRQGYSVIVQERRTGKELIARNVDRWLNTLEQDYMASLLGRASSVGATEPHPG